MMPTNRRKNMRKPQGPDGLRQALVQYLLDGKWLEPDAPYSMGVFLFVKDIKGQRALWEEVREVELPKFEKKYPGSKPYAYYIFDQQTTPDRARKHISQQVQRSKTENNRSNDRTPSGDVSNDQIVAK